MSVRVFQKNKNQKSANYQHSPQDYSARHDETPYSPCDFSLLLFFIKEKKITGKNKQKSALLQEKVDVFFSVVWEWVKEFRSLSPTTKYKLGRRGPLLCEHRSWRGPGCRSDGGAFFGGGKNHLRDSKCLSFCLSDVLLLLFITEKKEIRKKTSKNGRCCCKKKMDVCFFDLVAMGKGVRRPAYSDN